MARGRIRRARMTGLDGTPVLIGAGPALKVATLFTA